MEHLVGSVENSVFGAAMPFGDLGFLPKAKATEIEGREQIFQIQGAVSRRHGQAAARFFHEAQPERRRPIQIGILPPIQDARLLTIQYSPEPPYGQGMLKKAREALAARIRRASLGEDAEERSGYSRGGGGSCLGGLDRARCRLNAMCFWGILRWGLESLLAWPPSSLVE